MLVICPITAADFGQVCPIIREAVLAQENYAFDSQCNANGLENLGRAAACHRRTGRRCLARTPSIP
jgi:hypothetical protein